MSATILDTTYSGELTDYVTAFERDGFVHMRSLFTREQIAEFHQMREAAVKDWCFAAGTMETPDAVDDLIERFPLRGLAAVTHPTLLGLAEALMGPVVQLDSAVLASDPPVDRSRYGEPVAWHRDRFGFFPLGVYTRPQSIVYLAYMQDMTDDVGPLRVIPGSHREPVAIDLDARTRPHPHEVFVRTAPGDVIAVHHNLLHSGTCNVSNSERRFLGFIFNMSSLIHRDNFDGPNCQALIATARRTNDRRTLRLLGEDPRIVPRQNSGFIQPHTAYWPSWNADDEQFAADAADERSAVDRAREVLA